MLNVKKISTPSLRQSESRRILAWTVAALSIGFPTLLPAQGFSGFTPNNLVVSRSVYEGTATTLTVGETLPPNCPTTATCTGAGVGGPATNNGAFPIVGSTNNVWNNDAVDGSFGVTSPIFLDQISTGGTPINTLAIPTTGQNQIVTSFSSKSELALNLSLDGKYITFMGYLSPVNALDVSNANTNGVIDPTNPVGEDVDRGVGQVDTNGNLTVTDTYLYSGNNGRAAIYTGDPSGVYFTAGNDNNGAQPTAGPPFTPVLTELIASTGVQVVVPGSVPTTNFVAAGVYPPAAGDKPGKDNNFRGLTIFNNTLYVTKGSGSNGIDTVYQVGTAGTLPTGGGTTITVLPGFPTAKAKTAGINNIYPFGVWFANSTTLYVADEGDGVVADAPNSIYAGLQKWTLVSGSWQLDYVLQKGLNLGQQYGLPNYPSAINPATAGLRNLTGRVNTDGTVTLWAVTSTVSANGDQGADPNLLVSIVDDLANLSAAAAAGETFQVIKAANYGEVLRGVSFTPGTTFPAAPGAIVITSSALVYSRVSKTYHGTLTIENNSSNAISGTVTVALNNLTPGVTFLGDPVQGTPEVVFTLSSPLAPGQSASLPISFSDPTNTLIQFTPAIVVPQS
jgi:hypothetical protein